MAKKSKIVKDGQRREIVARYAKRRAELKHIIESPYSTDEERTDAQYELDRQPHDTPPICARNRDAANGRLRGYLHRLGLSHVRVCEMVHRGELPGIRKSSW